MSKSFDFEADLKQLLINDVEEYGVKLTANKNIDDFLLAYYTIRKKIIFPKKRLVKCNSEFKKQLENHLKKGQICDLVKLFELGGDVNWHQSARLIQTNAHDHLAYEWNIYHFHLSNETEKKSRFMKRSNSLLFAYIDEVQVILLGTETHKDGVFGETKWQEILHDFFPEVIEPFQESTISEISPNLNGKERQAAWDSGLTLTFTKIKGQMYQSPGIGRSTSGHSLLVVNNTNSMLRWLQIIKTQFQMHFMGICNHLNVPPEQVEFKLISIAGRLVIFESVTKSVLFEFPNILNECIIYDINRIL